MTAFIFGMPSPRVDPAPSAGAPAAARQRSGSMTIGRVLGVLDCLSVGDGPLTLTEIAHSLDVPKPSLSDILAAMLETGHLHRDAGGRYALGPASHALGQRLCAQAQPPAPLDAVE